MHSILFAKLPTTRKDFIAKCEYPTPATSVQIAYSYTCLLLNISFFTIHIHKRMQPVYLLKATAVIIVSALCLQKASAQSTPANPGPDQSYLIPNQLVGNQLGGGTFFITGGNGADDASHIILSGPNSGSRNYIGFSSAWNPNGASSISHGFFVRRNGPDDFFQAMAVRQSGQVLIGSPVPQAHSDFKLSVDGKLVTKSLYVTTQNWADFVFEPTYKPMSLPALETYLKENKHLPAIPAAKEVIEKGIDVAEMNVKLLQSVEELTLHVIELNKQNQQLRVDVNELKSNVSSKVKGGK